MAIDTSLIITTDRHYLIPALILFKNLTNHSQESYNVEFWFSYSVKDSEVILFKELICKLNEVFNVKFYRQEKLEAPGYKYLTSGAWIRLCAMELPRPEVSLLIYLDCDLFLKSDWDNFIKTIPKKFNGLIARRTPGHRDFELKYPSNNLDSYYFNSGVLFFGSRWWFDFGYSNKWKNILVNYDNLGFKTLDQDLLNYMIRDQYTLLPIEMNSYPHEVDSRTKIIHFAGISKPWGFFQINFRNCNGMQLAQMSATKRSYSKNLKSIIFLVLRYGGILGLELVAKFYIRFTTMNLKNILNTFRQQG